MKASFVSSGWVWKTPQRHRAEGWPERTVEPMLQAAETLHPQRGPCAYHYRARMYPRWQTAYSGKSYVWGPRQSPGKHWALRWDVRLAIWTWKKVVEEGITCFGQCCRIRKFKDVTCGGDHSLLLSARGTWGKSQVFVPVSQLNAPYNFFFSADAFSQTNT